MTYRPSSATPVALPWWVGLVTCVAALASVASDLRGSWAPRSAVEASAFALPYLSIMLAGLRPRWALPLLWIGLGISIGSGDYAVGVLAACGLCFLLGVTQDSLALYAHGVVGAVWAAAVAARSDPSLLWLLGPLLSVSWLVSYLLAGTLRRNREQASQLRHLEEVLAAVRHEERATLARELHDVVAHELTLIAMQAMSCSKVTDPVVLGEVLEAISGSSRSALIELRKLLIVLRREGGSKQSVPVQVALDDIEVTLGQLSRKLEALGFPASTRFTDAGLADISAVTATTTVRVLQESVSNIAKHAPVGASCLLQVEIDGEEVDVTVTSGAVLSAGRGGRPRVGTGVIDRHWASSGTGLIGLKERVALLKGQFEAGPHSAGWQVRAEIPCNLGVDVYE